MNENLGSLNISFTANDAGVQKVIDNIISSIDKMQNGIQEKMDKVNNSISQSMAKTSQSLNKIKDSAKVVQSSSTSIVGSLGKIGTALKTLLKFAVFSWLGRQIIKFGKQLFNLASDMAEVENLFAVSFGDMTKQASDFADRLNEAWGVDVTPIKEQTAYMNQMFKSMGIGANTSYTLSTELEKLSYNIASLYNLDQEDAYEKLRSGMVGQMRPLTFRGAIKKFIV